ncbi:MAG: ParB/RepB/Spo0J family partition protein [Phormidesmis sp. RL_2_1]|nr:ParB/RepB/Spo0J family partition protein [Phormidesmis sp. RL_2_1]
MTKSQESFNLSGKGILGGFLSGQPAAQLKAKDAAAELIPIDKIVTSPLQPRQFFSQASIDSLAKAFKEHGFRGALNVRPKADGTYELVAGERRWRAAHQAQLEKVRCIVDAYTDEEALEFSLMENLQREDLSKLEETEGVLHFIEVKLGIAREQAVSIIRTEGHSDKASRSDVAPSEELRKIEGLLSLFNIGLQTFRTKNLRTLSLPTDLKTAHLEQNLPYSSALELSKLKDDDERQKILAEVLQKGMSFRNIKSQVQDALEKRTKSSNQEDRALVKRFDEVARQAKKSQRSFENASKRKRIEKLLSELESLLTGE